MIKNNDSFLSATENDFLIVGGGIIGLTLAYELKKRHPSARIVILEKEPLLGRHASGRNSGVLHSGIYYSSDTLKAKVCVSGAQRMKQFAAEHNIPCRQGGKVIVASSANDTSSLDKLMKNARENHIQAERLDEQGVRRIEPHAYAPVGGIYCADTAVIDPQAVLEKLLLLLRDNGVTIRFDEKVVGIDTTRKTVVTSKSQYSYCFFFNCAGAYADVIARRFGLCRDYTLLPFKGIYYKLSHDKDFLVKANIYPVPDLFLPFLGVHFTRDIHGDVYIGPTAIPALGRENYQIFHGINLAECLEIGWLLGNMYFRNIQNFRALVHIEMQKYSKRYFLECARKLVPEVSSDDLLPCSKVGIRPQLVNLRTKKLEMDYILELTNTSLHVLNAISPAFTSAFSFAELLADRFSGITEGRQT